MRYTIVLLVAMMSFIGTPAEAQKSKDKDQFTAKVDGLGCAYCAYGLEKKLLDLKGIKKIKIELETGIVSFSFPATDALSIDDVKTKVDKAGYTPVWVEVKRADGKVEKSKESASTEKLGLVTKKIEVKGNCGMCKSRIEKAALSLEGVSSASWDALTQSLELEFDDSEVSLLEIEKAIAKAGHDSENAKADDKVYDNLHGCCKYDR